MLLILLAAVLGGTLSTLLFDDDAPLPARVAAGVPIGLVLFGLGAFLGASMAGRLGASAIAMGVAVALGPSLVLLRPEARARLLESWAVTRAMALGTLRHPTWFRVLQVGLGLFAARVLWAAKGRAMIDAPDGGIHTGVDHNLGDLPFHLAIVTRFAYGANFPPEHPELAGARLTYPFLNDFVSATFVAAGTPLRDALFGPAVLLAIALLALLFRWAAHLTGDRLAALITPALVLLSGGFGFVLLGREVDPLAGGLVGYLGHPTADYTIRGTGEMRWGNLVTTMLMTQRSLLLGLPVVMVVWQQWWKVLAAGGDERPDAPVARRRRLIAAGVLTGLLPLAHAHAFAVTVAVGAFLGILAARREWTAFVAPALVLGVPQVVWLAGGGAVETGRFLAFHVGWDREATRGVVGFWLMNLGLFLPLALWAAAGLFVRVRRGAGGPGADARLLWALAFLPCLLLPNLVQLSPWIWDNIKFLVFWHVAAAPLVAQVVVRVARSGHVRMAGAMLFLLVFSGALDVWRVVSSSVEHPIYQPAAVAFGHRLRAVTPEDAVVLHAPTYNSEVYLAGRRSVIGYPGHTWSQGLAGGTREAEVQAIYAGAAEAAGLIRRHGVTHVLVGPQERQLGAFDEGALAPYRVVAESGEYRLLEVAGSKPRP